MNKIPTALKLPKIEDHLNHKSQPYFHTSKDVAAPHLSTLKSDKKLPKPMGTLNTEGDSPNIGGRRGFSSDKAVQHYGDHHREESLFANSTIKQTWLLKKLEEQRESLTKKPQFLGLKGSPNSTNSRIGPKASHLNQMLNAMNSNLQDRDSIYAKKRLYEDAAASKSMNLGSNKFAKSPGALNKKKLEVDTEPLQEPVFNIGGHDKSPYQYHSGPKTTMNKHEKPRFPSHLSPIDESDKGGNGNVNIDLVIKLEEKLRLIFENNDSKGSILPYLKDYLEAVDKDEIIQVESLFFDTRMRRNLKTYIMLEKTAMFAILAIISDETPIKDTQEMHLRNICHYVYSNFLNFVDTLVSKLELLPRYNQTSYIEKLRNLTKGKASDVDRSFGLEQINKLLIKVLRTSLKQSLQKKGERYPKVDLILEKTEFGLMLNYFDELKITFQDLLQKHKIDVKFTKTPSEPESAPENNGNMHTPLKKRASKPEKNKLSPSSAKLSPLEHSPTKTVAPKEYHLPPAIPKEGQEHKPVYTLVLDMDETLIHFEEVGGKGRFFVRPYAEKFLKEMAELYEVVVFTAGVKDYADAVLNILDPHGYITHRLYRHHTTLKPSVPGVIKDLTRLGRDMSKILIVDNAPENFRLQVDNGLEIISWYNDPYDTELLDMSPFLKDLVINQVEDVRKHIKKYKEKKRYRRN